MNPRYRPLRGLLTVVSLLKCGEAVGANFECEFGARRLKEMKH